MVFIRGTLSTISIKQEDKTAVSLTWGQLKFISRHYARGHEKCTEGTLFEKALWINVNRYTTA